MNITHYLAFDIGASSGRAILGTLEGDRVSLQEVHRFSNEMSFQNGHYHWNIFRLFEELKLGLRKCIHEFQITPDSIAIDTWGVDFGLIGDDDKLLGWPFAYRDSITDNAMEEVFAIVEPFELYKMTGIQFMKFNSLFQLWAIKKKYPALIKKAKKLLFMPDLLGYMFTGKYWAEQTIASTSQMVDPENKSWLMSLMDTLDLPTDILQETVSPGNTMGKLLPEIQKELDCPAISVVASCAHDTAAAIAAIPAAGNNWVYISSGTWSLMGMELNKPVLNEHAFTGSFTNEGGFDGTTRFLKNITGLWLLQECKKIWDNKEILSYSELVEKSTNAPPFQSLVDPDHQDFMNPANMQEAIINYCRRTDQVPPAGIPEFTRCIFESLALKYRYTLELLQKAHPSKPQKIHIIGGGTHNELLCQYTANATGLNVIAGPAEGAALGNILVQAYAAGKVGGMNEIRQVARNSVQTKSYKPENMESWEQAYKQWKKLTQFE